jgi:arginyl-tRNA synthetase
MEHFAQIVMAALNEVLEKNFQVNECTSFHELQLPQDPQWGDFSFACFSLAKSVKTPPSEIASTIFKLLQEKALPDITVTQIGAYLNFTLSHEALCHQLLPSLLCNPKDTQATRGTWILEFSSPNIAKPLNIYHLRTTALGAALYRIGKARGYRMIAINHLGDWGKQYGMLALAFKKYQKNPSDMKMQELVELYVKINQDAKQDPELESQAREAFLHLEQGNPEMVSLWKTCVAISLESFQKQYQDLNVIFDHTRGESYYLKDIPAILKLLREQNLLVPSEGAWVVHVENQEGQPLPPCLLQKGDGATLYATRDLAAALQRYEEFSFDRMTYIVGSEQRLHFQQLFSLLKKMQLPWASRCEHLPTGLYRFEDTKMSTRQGNFVTLEEVIKITEQKVIDLIQERKHAAPQGALSSLQEVSHAIALGAIIFHDLHTDPARNVDFHLEKIVDFEGQTGPHLQYAHTRCLSVLRKAKVPTQKINHLSEKEELLLLRKLGQFPFYLEQCLKLTKVSPLSHYLMEIVRLWNQFYKNCKILHEDPQIAHSRLLLVEATRQVLAEGLGYLGIPLPEWM